ncbi:hypothetical protein RMQ97_13265 [Maricaulis sp. D1M11]|uniref:hypothetical protein n=1 Tax=Maricaulis sp. D1M11 TaxID=3076117 RepID=UPI0039B67BFB
MRRLKDAEEIQDQQAFQRQISGAAAEAGEIASAAGARRQAADATEREEKERKERVDRAIILESLGDFEANLEDQYGPSFAENLFAELFEAELIEADEYATIMAIEDEDERRIAIAAAIQRGIDEGHIDPDDLEGHPWAQEWLSRHHAEAARRDREVEMGLNGEMSAAEMSAAARDEAKHSSLEDTPDRESSFEAATVNAEQGNSIDSAGANFLAGRSLG